jgi:hypothetical protein
VALNLLFRLGIKQRTYFTVPELHPAPASEAFIHSQGAIWGARSVVIARAARSIGEAIEVVAPQRTPDSEPLRLEAAFDEFFLDLTLFYPGAPLSLTTDSQGENPASWLDMDGDALERALDALPLIMLKRLADQVRSGTRDQLAYLQLRFEH